MANFFDDLQSFYSARSKKINQYIFIIVYFLFSLAMGSVYSNYKKYTNILVWVN